MPAQSHRGRRCFGRLQSVGKSRCIYHASFFPHGCGIFSHSRKVAEGERSLTRRFPEHSTTKARHDVAKRSRGSKAYRGFSPPGEASTACEFHFARTISARPCKIHRPEVEPRRPTASKSCAVLVQLHLTTDGNVEAAGPDKRAPNAYHV